jgi:hypothetical protein
MECVVSVNGIQALCNVFAESIGCHATFGSDGCVRKKLLDADESKRNYQVMMDEWWELTISKNCRQHPNNDVFEKQATSLSSTLEARDDEDRTCSRNRGRDIHL